MITGNVMKINTHDPKEWLSLKEVAYLLRVSRNTVSRLCQEIDPTTQQTFLHCWRPCPKLLMISRASFQRYCAVTQADPYFWEKRDGRNRWPRRIRPRPVHRSRKPGAPSEEGAKPKNEEHK
jgi:hypothetical protein